MSEKLTYQQQALVRENLGLARKAALEAYRKSPALHEKDEFVSAAYLGLVRAAADFRPHEHGMSQETIDSGKAFAGFARRKIVGHILDWQRSQDYVPKRLRAAYRDLVEKGLGTTRTPEQLSDITGMPVEQISKLIQAIENRTHFLDHEIRLSNDAPEDGRGSRQVPSKTDTEASVIGRGVMDQLRQEFNGLPSVQQSIVALRYYQGFELPYIAEVLEMRVVAVREEHAEAILRLHDAMTNSVKFSDN